MDRSEAATRILAEWICQREADEAIAPEELLAQYPELAMELGEGLQGIGLLELPFGEEPRTTNTPLQRIGDYRIIRELGRGGMGVVYEAEQMSMARPVALKVLTPSLTTPGRAVKRFQQEAKAAGRLHHTNIVPVFALGEEHGHWYYAMELVRGRALDDLLRDLKAQPSIHPSESGPDLFAEVSNRTTSEQTPHPSPDGGWYRRIATLFAGVADALDLAHEEGVVHRDVKPSNLLLDADGTLKLVDFGLAHLDAPGPAMTLSGDLLGTPAYMSPEQALVKRVRLDHRTDIYSLGATLYEVLTLRPPFAGESLHELCSNILTKDPEAPRRRDARIPRDLETIVLEAMEKDRGRRYQRSAEMAEDLRRFALGSMIAARRAGVVERTWRIVKRHPGLAALTATTTLATTVAVALALLASSERRRLDAHAYETHLLAAHQAFTAEFLRPHLTAVERVSADDEGATLPVALAADHGTVDAVDASDPGPSEAALRCLHQAIEIDPMRPEAYWLRALVPTRDRDDRLADISLASSRGLDAVDAAYLLLLVLPPLPPGDTPPELPEPVSPLARFARATAARDGDVPGTAFELLSRTIRSTPPGNAVHTLARAERARRLTEQRDHRAALEDWLALAGSGHDSVFLDTTIAATWRALGQTQAAERRFGQALEKATGGASERGWREILTALGPSTDNFDWLRRAAELAVSTRSPSARLTCNFALRLRTVHRSGRWPAGSGTMDSPLSAALTLYDHALTLDPDFVPALQGRLSTLRHIYRERGGRDLAIEVLTAFDDWERQVPDDQRIPRDKARFLVDLGRFEEAEQICDRILQTDSSDDRTLWLHLILLSNAHRNVEALNEATRLIERNAAEDRNDAMALVGLPAVRGRSYERLGRHESAEQDLAEAIAGMEALRQRPDRSDRDIILMGFAIQVYLDHADTLIELGRYPEALDRFEWVLERRPAHRLALQNRLAVRQTIGDEAGALEAAQDALKHHPDDALFLAIQGDLLMKVGDHEAGAASYLRALEHGQSDPDRLAWMAEHSAQARRYALAVTAVERLIELHGDNPAHRGMHARWLEMAGLLHARLGHPVESARFLTRAVGTDPALDLYNPACMALRASAQVADANEARRLREQTLAWLRTMLRRASGTISMGENRPPNLRPDVWLLDTDLHVVRDPGALAALPDAERFAWQAFWREVATWVDEHDSPDTTRVAALINEARTLYAEKQIARAVDAELRALAILTLQDDRQDARLNIIVADLARFVALEERADCEDMTEADLLLALEVHETALEFVPPSQLPRIYLQRRRSWALGALGRWPDALTAMHDVRQCRASRKRKLFDFDRQWITTILLEIDAFAEGSSGRAQRALASRYATRGAFTPFLLATGTQQNELRTRAHAWLRTDLESFSRELDSADPTIREAAARSLRRMLEDENLAPSRSSDLLAGLPNEERAAWNSLWNDARQALSDSAPSPYDGR